jgi:hypothetical protein
MAEPVGPLSQPLQPQQTSQILNVPALSRQMQDQVLTLADHLQKVKDDPTLSTHQPFLNEFVDNASHLSQTVNQAILVR